MRFKLYMDMAIALKSITENIIKPGALGAQDRIHALAAHRAAGQVIAAVEREQREDGPVDALIGHPGKIRIRRGQIAPADLRRVAPDGGQGEDDTRIVR